MRTSSPSVRLGFDAAFTRSYVAVLGLVPIALLGFDAIVGKLPANGVNFAIRTTGFLGLLCLALSLAITPLRRLSGWNGLIAARRSLGLLGFGYIGVHFAIFFLLDRGADVGSTLDEIVARRYLNVGIGAFLLMIPLAVTSTDGWVTRLGPRRWKALHRLAYVAAIGGVVHYYLLVKSDVRKPVGFAIAIGVLLAARMAWHYLDLRRAVAGTKARPAPAVSSPARFWSGELQLARVFQETHDVRTFRLVPPGGGELPFRHLAGQYLNLALSIDGKATRRSYTIASSPTRSSYIEITVKRKPGGFGSNHIHDTWREGDLIKVSAPAGNFHFTAAGHDCVLLLAGGVGATPLMSIARALTDRAWSGQIYFVFSVRTPGDVIFGDELAQMARRFPNFHLCIACSAPPIAGEAWAGERGHVDAALLTRHVPGIATMPVYLCGPEPMMVAMRALLIGLGVPDAEIHMEAFVSPVSDPSAVIPSEVRTVAGASRSAEGAAAVGDGPDAAVPITFSRSGREVTAAPGQTVLEAAEADGLALAYECRAGICGQCKVALTAGRVAMDAEDALTAADRTRGIILACQARPRTALTIDA